MSECATCGEASHDTRQHAGVAMARAAMDAAVDKRIEAGRPKTPGTSTRQASRSEQAARWVAEHGGTLEAAGEKFGISHQAVTQLWRRLYPDVPTPETVRRSEKHAREKAARALRVAAREEAYAAALAMVSAGSTLVDAVSAVRGVKVDTLRGRMRKLGIELVPDGRKRSAGRRDGRTKRAVARVLAGEPIAEACRAENCASTMVYVALKKLRTT